MKSFENIFRSIGYQAVLYFVVGGLLFGSQPHVGTQGASLLSFYDSHSTRIYIATVILGFGVLSILWFSQALATALADAGVGGWGRAQTAASTALAALLFLHLTITATLAYTADSISPQFASGLNDLSWVLQLLAFFPAAMVVMSGSFGLHRAGAISKRWFLSGVSVMALLLLGTTTYAADGFWAVDGAYTRVIAPAFFLLWIAVASRFLSRQPSELRAPYRNAVSAA